jgi:hypothetical protein
MSQNVSRFIPAGLGRKNGRKSFANIERKGKRKSVNKNKKI